MAIEPTDPTETTEPGSTEEGPPDGAHTPGRPGRPVAIEVSAAVLIVLGLFGLFQTLANGLSAPSATTTPDVIVASEIGLDVLRIMVGLLVRAGLAWIADVNVAAVFAFLYVLGYPNAVSLFFAAVHTLIVLGLFANKPWFDAMGAWRRGQTAPSRRRA